MKSHYEVLGVGIGASADEIRAAYKAQIRKFHPDVYEGSAEEATEKAIELNGAYAVLSDPERRTIYDRMLHPKAPEPPPKNSARKVQSPYAPEETWAVPKDFHREAGWTAYADRWANRPAVNWTPGHYERHPIDDEDWKVRPEDLPPDDDDAPQASAPQRPLSAEEEWAAYADQWANRPEERTPVAIKLLYGVGVLYFAVFIAQIALMMSAMGRPKGLEMAACLHACIGWLLFAELWKGNSLVTIPVALIYLAAVTLITGALFLL